MRNRHRALVLAAGALIAAAAPAAASATTYCVHLSGSCEPGQVDDGADIQQALDHAGGHPGMDRVQIGPGSYPGTFTYDSTEAIEVRGAGIGQTVLTGTPTTGAIVLNLSTTQATLGDLSVQLSGGDNQTGVVINVGTLERVAIDGAASPGSYGVVYYGPGTVTQSHLDADSVPFQTFGGNNLGTVFVTDSTLVGDIGVVARDTSAQLERVKVQASTVAGRVAGADLSFDDSLLEVAAPAASGAIEAKCSLTGPSVAHLDSVTLVGPATGVGVAAHCGPTGSATALVEESIVGGFANSLHRQSTGGDASLSVTESDLDLATALDEGGPGSLTDEGHNLFVDPGFVSPTDFHLRPDSPLIDRIEVEFNHPGVHGTDLDGNPRLFGPGLDVGAYEWQGTGDPPTLGGGSTDTPTGDEPDPTGPVTDSPAEPVAIAAPSVAAAPALRGACAHRGGAGYAITWPAAGRARIEWRTSVGNHLVAVGQGTRAKAGHGCLGARVTARGKRLLAAQTRTPIVIAVTFTPADGGPAQRVTRRGAIGRPQAS